MKGKRFQLQVMVKVREEHEADPDRIVHLDTLTKKLVAELDASLARLEAPPRRGPMLMFGMAVLGVIAMLALLAMFIARWIERADQESGRVMRLPDVKVGERLGAPCGGGRISSKEFREPAGDS